MVNPKTYRFSTLNELLDVVPADRVEACVDELGVILAKTSQLRVLITEAARLEDPTAPVPSVRIPEPFEWIDDGEQRIEIKLGDTATLRFSPDGGLKEIVR